MKTFKRLFMLFAAVIMTLSVAVNYPSFSSAEGGYAGAQSEINSIPRKATIGQPVEVGTSCYVFSPKGEKITLSAGIFTPEEAGFYSVCADADGKAVFGQIKVTVPDVRLKLPFGGAEIPTVTSVNKEITLPVAYIEAYDEDGNEIVDTQELQKIKDSFGTPTVEVRTGSGIASSAETSKITVTDNKFTTLDKAGSYLVRYKVTNGTIEKTLDFTVTTQIGFEDKEKPVISVTNVPSSGNLFTKVTIPSASATDNYDNNVKIEVAVKDKNGNPVKEVDEDDEEDIKEKADAQAVEFDNTKPMYFYPLEEGRYTVTYTATDDSYPSSPQTTSSWIVTVGDTLAPVIKIEEENEIPTVWGKQVYKANPADENDKEGIPVEGDDLLLKIPFGKATDNVKTKDGDGKVKDIVVNVSLRDPKGTTFFNTSSTSMDAVSENGKVDSIEKKDGYYTFDISKYAIVKNGEKTGDDTTGAYTITYRAEDAKGNPSSKTYTVTYEAVYRDLDAPAISVSNKEDLFWAGEKFVKPTVKVSDENNTRVIVNDEFTFTGKVGGETFTAKNFKELDKNFKAITSGTSLYDIMEKDGQFTIPEDVSGTVNYAINARDQVSNDAKPTVDSVGEILIKKFTESNKPAFGATFNLYTEKDGGDDYKVNEEVALLKDGEPITLTAAANEYLGYEVLVHDSYKKAVRTTVDAKLSDAEIVINKINFKPTSEGEHTIYIRGLTISGASVIRSVTFNVEPSDKNTGTWGLSSNTVPSTAEVGTAISLPNHFFVANGDWVPYVEIIGTRYELKGKFFTARDAGDYIIKVYQINSKTGKPGQTNISTITVADSTDPVIQALKAIENYKDKFNETKYDEEAKSTDAEKLAAARKHMVEIPDISVINVSGAVTVTRKITHSKVTKDISEFKLEVKDGTAKKGTYYFIRPTDDGTYTVTYTAASSTRSNTHAVTVKVGDLVAPELTVKGTHSLTAKQNEKFFFKEVEVTDTVSELSYISVVKTIYYPNGEEYKRETGRAATSTNASYPLDKAGTYKVVYKATDEAGNVAEKTFSITVSAKATNTTSRQVILTILIILIAVLAIGLIVYFIFFGKVNGDKRQAKNKDKELKSE